MSLPTSCTLFFVHFKRGDMIKELQGSNFRLRNSPPFPCQVSGWEIPRISLAKSDKSSSFLIYSVASMNHPHSSKVFTLPKIIPYSSSYLLGATISKVPLPKRTLSPAPTCCTQRFMALQKLWSPALILTSLSKTPNGGWAQVYRCIYFFHTSTEVPSPQSIALICYKVMDIYTCYSPVPVS